MFLHPHDSFDNSAADYRHIEALPLAAAMGAEIRGVDLTRLSNEQFAEIEHALYRHKMIFFRDARIDHAVHAAFSARFGPSAEDAYTDGVTGQRAVQPVIKEADDRSAMVFGSGWHTDSPFLPSPPAISTLRAIEVPPYGGDTIWANTALAYRALSDTMRRMVADLEVRFSMRDVLASAQAHSERRDSPIGRLAATGALAELPPVITERVRGHAHPLVRPHTVTGELALYVDGSYAIAIEGMQPAESAALLEFLVDHITQPAFTCRLRWAAGTLALWDNRCAVHQAFNDYPGDRREMYRTTIGERLGS
jgi:taurine dioxygenase